MAPTASTTVSYLGQLFQQIKRPNALLKMAGAFAGKSMGESFAYEATTAITFPIGVFYQLAAPSQPSVLEGANAPAASTTSLTQATNVVQLFHETIAATYLAQSQQTVSGIVPIPLGEAQGQVVNPRSVEWQVRARLQKIAQDVNYSFLRGAYVSPADPTTTALQTRGLVTAIVSNIIDQTGTTANTITAAIFRGYVQALLQSMITYNGYNVDDSFCMFCDATTFGNAVNAYAAAVTNFVNPTVQVAGLQVRRLLTTFGELLLVLEPDMPANTALIAKMDEVAPVGLEVPGKGVIFEEMLYKQGSADQTQIYGQLGIDHGPEYYHGLLKLPAGVAINP